MEYRDEKRRLYRRLVVKGARRPEVKKIATDDGVAAPPELIDKWENRFFEAPINTYPTEPRLINRFCVGADPEFIFEEPKVVNAWGQVEREARYAHAERLGLNTIDAFGCDMSGRQAELRAFPSRFVLEVVASLVDTVRWMNEDKKLDQYHWIAPAQYQNDGVGGHVHIGRKRPDTLVCVKSLDSVTSLLLAAHVLDEAGQKKRVQSTTYGRQGDWRPQSHGYEYRTMPSWMTSPWAAYFTLVVSKLCVLDDAREFLQSERPKETLTNLLRAYKGRDDDARIALLALEHHGFPVYKDDDFKTRWGVPQARQFSNLTEAAQRYYYPPVIEASKETDKELFEYLTVGTAIPKQLPKPTWAPHKLPDGFYKPTVAPHIYGISDVAQGLLAKGMAVQFNRNDRGRLDILGQKKLDEDAIREAMTKHPALEGWSVRAVTDRVDGIIIYIPSDIYDNRAHATDKNKRNALRSVLLETGLFPLVKYTEWDKPVEKKEVAKKKSPRPMGRVISNVRGEAELVEA